MRVIGLIGPKGSGKDTSYELLRDAKRVDGKISFAGPLKTICSEVFDLPTQLLNDPDLKERPLKTPITLTAKHVRRIINLCEQYVPSITPEGIIKYRSNAIPLTGLEGRQFKTPRELMQFIGTELIRERIYQSFHLEAAFSPKVLDAVRVNNKGEKRRVYKADGLYAVTDVRFENEHEFLSKKFAGDYVSYYVKRPTAEEALQASLDSGKAHQSETETQKLRDKVTGTIENAGSLDELKETLKSVELPTGLKKDAAPAEKGSRFRYVPR